MTEMRYKITMDGSLAPGVTLDFAQENFARLFKTDVSAVKRLFSAGNTVIKRDISEAEADKYVAALFNAGVIARKEADFSANLSLESIESDTQADSAGRMVCPKCDTEQAHRETCATCGIVIAKFNNYQAQAKQAISSATVASPYAAPLAMVDDDSNEVGELNIWGIQGRIGRMRYVAWSMVFMFAMLPVMLVCALGFKLSPWLGGLLALAASIGAIIVGVQISVKRLHDIGWSGWLILISLIPVAGSIFQILTFVMPGSKASNLYGAPPPENSQAVKVLFWIWLAFLIIGVVVGVASGFLASMLASQSL